MWYSCSGCGWWWNIIMARHGPCGTVLFGENTACMRVALVFWLISTVGLTLLLLPPDICYLCQPDCCVNGLQKEWWGAGTGWPERLWIHCPRRCSRPGRIDCRTWDLYSSRKKHTPCYSACTRKSAHSECAPLHLLKTWGQLMLS